MSGPLPTGSVNATWARALLDALVCGGVRRLAFSPGLRSAPLLHAARALAAEDRLTVDVFVDERCAAFAAAGYARAAGEPVALLSTSGTAGAHWLPALLEARAARLPLIALTADRPRRLRDCGAPQTIDQRRLFGDAVLEATDLPPASADPRALRHLGGLATRAVQRATGWPAGPVHLNVPLDAPLEPAGAHVVDGPTLTVRPGRPVADAATVAEVAGRVRAAPRGLVVAGPADGESGAAARVRAEATGYPLLADPLSDARDAGTCLRYDAALTALVDAGAPPAIDLVLRVGGTPTSKGWYRLLNARPAEHVIVDPAGYREPARCPATLVAAEPLGFARALSEALDGPAVDAGWREAWQALDRRADVGLADWFEGRVVQALLRHLPEAATLWVASSKPVRELEWFGGPLSVRALGARGANGIDGLVSQALGAARARPGHPAALLVGDLGLLHDVGGLWAVGREPELDLTIVAVNDDGGGIFELLPIARQRAGFEEHVAVAHGLDFAHAAAQFGLAYTRVEDAAGLDAALAASVGRPGATLVEVTLDRAANTAAHADWRAAVAAAVEGWTP